MIEAQSQADGMLPSLGARVRTGSGHWAFVKATGPELNQRFSEFYRREARITSLLPPEILPHQLLRSHDEGDGGSEALTLTCQPAQPPGVEGSPVKLPASRHLVRARKPRSRGACDGSC